MTLAFQAGSINAGGYLACHKFVTHTTGFATAFGTEFASGKLLAALSMVSVPLFFLAGTMTSAYFVDHKIANAQKPRYDLLFLLVIISMLVVVFLGLRGTFGEFGAEVFNRADYGLLAILCLASGIQNASITSASGSVVRTTHLTGITTDLGIGLVRLFSKGLPQQTKQVELKANIMRAGIIGFFILGSAASAFIFIHAKYLGFLIPATTATMIFIYGKFFSHGHPA